MIRLHILRNGIIFLILLFLLPLAVYADDDHSIEFVVKDGDNLYNICEKILENPEDWRWIMMYKLFLDIGKTISTIKKSTGKETRFEIQTPSAVAAARGTEFRAGVDTDVTTRLEVLAGKVDVTAAKSKVEVSAGEGTVVKKDQKPEVPVKLLPPPALMNFQPLYRAMPLDFQFESMPASIPMAMRENSPSHNPLKSKANISLFPEG